MRERFRDGFSIPLNSASSSSTLLPPAVWIDCRQDTMTCPLRGRNCNQTQFLTDHERQRISFSYFASPNTSTMQHQRRHEDRYRQDQRAGSRNQQSSPRHLHPISPFPPHHHELPPTRNIQRHPTIPSSNRQQPIYQSHPSSNRPIYRNQHFPTAPPPTRQPNQPSQPQYKIAQNYRSPASCVHARQDHQNDFARISQRPRILDPPPRSITVDHRRPEHDAAEILQRMGGGGWVGYESKEDEMRRGSEDSGFEESRSVETHGSAVTGVGWTDGIRKVVWGDGEQNRGSELSVFNLVADEEAESIVAAGLARGNTMLNQNLAAGAIWNRVVAATSAISTSVNVLSQSTDDDDGTPDADGNTKLTRVIKQYVSRQFRFSDSGC